MKLRAIVLACWILTAMVAPGCAKQPAAASFEGAWRAANSSRGITRARIFQEAGAWSVQMEGGQLVVELYQSSDPQSPQQANRFFGVVRMTRES